MQKTKIEWVKNPDGTQGMVWNPVSGCTKVSQGCKNCYAERIYERFHPGQSFSKVHCYPGKLDEPLHVRKPQRIFVNSMSDLFHKDVPDEFIDDVLDTIETARQHTFIVLTKRPGRMRKIFSELDFSEGVYSNLWLGVSVEDQATADERIPLLLKTPAAVRFVSVEPMLGHIDLDDYLNQTIIGWQSEIGPYDSPIYDVFEPILDWVICGSESGPNARPFDIEWARDLKNQCVSAGVPFFFKQGITHGKLEKRPFLDGGRWELMPEVHNGR